MTPGAIAVPWDAIVLAGGDSRRMGGVDKVTLEVGGTPLLDRVLLTVAGAQVRVVVGPRRTTQLEVTWCREDPPGGGPAAALAAALPLVAAETVVLLAADQPFVDRDVVGDLLQAVAAGGGAVDGAVGVDESGSPQWLCSVWRVAALRRAGLAPGQSLRRTVGALAWQPVPLPEHAGLDCDTPDDLRRARELAP